MRFLKLAPCLALVLLVSGCFSLMTIEAAKSKDSTPLPDAIDAVEQASLTPDNQLLLFVEGRLTNSTRRAPYTLTVPLQEVSFSTVHSSRTSTNMITRGYYPLPRNGIISGWDLNEKRGLVSVPVGPPIRQLWDVILFDPVNHYDPLPGQDRTLYQLIKTWSNRVEGATAQFIYVDRNRSEAYLMITIKQYEIVTGHEGMYWMLPLAVAGDLATLPLQAICYALVLIFWSGGS